jgi:hypothetical protein
MYDSDKGRWFAPDPARQYWSGYVGMGNNPVSLVDPDGRFSTRSEARQFRRDENVGGIFNIRSSSTGDFYIKDGQTSWYHGYGIKGGFLASVNFMSGAATNGGGSWLSDAYNSGIGRMVVPDFLAVGVGFNGIAGVGGGTSIEFRWVTHGPEASWKPMITVTQSVGGGFSVDATLNIEAANYIGNVNNITRSMMQTSSPNGVFPTIWGSGGVAAGGKIGVTGYVTPNVGGSFIIGRELNLGAGLPAGPLPANGAGGASNTWILYDFYK